MQGTFEKKQRSGSNGRLASCFKKSIPWCMNRKFSRILGFSMIIFSWMIWGVILVLPFFKLTLIQYAVVYPILLAATNIFWVGAALVGKVILQKINNKIGNLKFRKP